MVRTYATLKRDAPCIFIAFMERGGKNGLFSAGGWLGKAEIARNGCNV